MGMKSLKALLGISFCCLVLLAAGCKTSAKTQKRSKVRSNTGSTVFDQVTKSTDIKTLVRTMTGSFTSAAQAKEDTSYYDISLYMYPIWTDKQDKYLYVEQAMTTDLANPYRQRIYKLIADGNGGFESHIYTLVQPERFVGKWAEPSFFDQFGEEVMEEREGCAVYLAQHADGSYSGSTRMDHCKSTMRGASYATSMVKIRENSVMSWDQGFDEAGQQVWGAEKGGYRFVRSN